LATAHRIAGIGIDQMDDGVLVLWITEIRFDDSDTLHTSSSPIPTLARLRRRRAVRPVPPGRGRGKMPTALASSGGLASAALSQTRGQGNGPLPPRFPPAPGVLPKPAASDVLPLDPCQRATPSRSPAVGLDCAPHPPG